MAADEYILNFLFAIMLQFQLGEQIQAFEYNINFCNFTELQFGLTNINAATSPSPAR
jgi:hypothetical protein